MPENPPRFQTLKNYANICRTSIFRLLPSKSTHWIARRANILFVVFIVGAVFFGAATTFRLRQLLTSRGPVVSLSESGFRDVRIAPEEIPWTAIRSIRPVSIAWSKFLVLEADPTIEGRLSLTPTMRRSRVADRTRGKNGLWVTAQGLELDFPILQRLCEERFARAHAS